MTTYNFSKVLNDIKMATRFLFGLKGYLANRIDPARVRGILKAKMEAREENFLQIVKKGIFEYKKSPYLPLFELARLTFEDVTRSVARVGLDETLKFLYSEGVTIKIEEFKGKKPIVCRGKEFVVTERDFDNPYIAACYERRSGGTRSAGTRIACDFDFLKKTAVYRAPIFDAWGFGNGPHVLVRPAVTYGTGMFFMLHLSQFITYPVKWFSLTDAKKISVSLKNKWGVAYLLYMSRAFGAKFPLPEFVDTEELFKIAEFVRDQVKVHKRCCVFTNVSTAVRICLAARLKGISLEGAIFHGCGEPLTLARKKEIESSGARYVLYYAFMEAGLVGCLCKNATAIDDVHLFSSFLATITAKRMVAGVEVDAFLFTSLEPSSAKIFLNVESGDYGVLEKRSCGCPFDDLGFGDHIHHVRSFEKLTSEGMTFYGTDLIRIVEEVFPRQFGGSSVDYQLAEEEEESGISRLLIRVSPSVGAIDEKGLIAVLLEELKKGGDSQRMMADMWSRMGTVKIKREFPVVSQAGKLTPLYITAKGER